MTKDIFIDNNIAKNFANPIDSNYKELISWLNKFDKNSQLNAHLVVSNALLKEYLDSSRNCSKSSSIPALISKLTMEGRLKKFKNNEIKDFQNQHFTKTISRSLLSNNKDHPHIAIVLMSARKYALTLDHDFFRDLQSFPRFNVTVAKRPEDIDYK